MARPNKVGVDYFPLDVDFYEDHKIEMIYAKYGIKGTAVALRLLTMIYRFKGYYCQWDKDQALLLARRIGDGISDSLVEEIVQELVKRSFFDQRICDTFGVLTSSGIQSRYIKAVEKRKEIRLIEEYLLINVGDYINTDNVKITSIQNDRFGRDDVIPFRPRETSAQGSVNSDIRSFLRTYCKKAYGRVDKGMEEIAYQLYNKYGLMKTIHAVLTSGSAGGTCIGHARTMLENSVRHEVVK